MSVPDCQTDGAMADFTIKSDCWLYTEGEENSVIDNPCVSYLTVSRWSRRQWRRDSECLLPHPALIDGCPLSYPPGRWWGRHSCWWRWECHRDPLRCPPSHPWWRAGRSSCDGQSVELAAFCPPQGWSGRLLWPLAPPRRRAGSRPPRQPPQLLSAYRLCHTDTELGLTRQKLASSPLSFSQSVEVELEVVFDLSYGVNENIEAGGQGDMVADGTEVVLDVVNLLLVLINNLVSVEHHVPTEQPRKASSKAQAETAVDGLGREEKVMQSIGTKPTRVLL